MNLWDKTHPLSADSDRLAELMPPEGNCESLQGELYRASSKIGYDWYNNGWGCNNWSGAVVFLEKHAFQFATKRTPEEHQAFKDALDHVRCYCHGEHVGISDEKADQLVTTIHAFVVQSILDNPTLIPNTIDMWEYSERDTRSHWYRDEDGDYDYDSQYD